MGYRTNSFTRKTNTSQSQLRCFMLLGYLNQCNSLNSTSCLPFEQFYEYHVNFLIFAFFLPLLLSYFLYIRFFHSFLFFTLFLLVILLFVYFLILTVNMYFPVHSLISPNPYTYFLFCIYLFYIQSHVKPKQIM